MSSRSFVPAYVKVLVVLAALVAGSYWVWDRYYRPVFLVEAVTRGKAVNAVSGGVTVREEIPTPIRSPVAGKISEANLAIGASVKEGDVLVKLDTGDIDLEIRKTQEEIEALENRIASGSEAALQLKLAEIEFENSTYMKNNSLLSPVDFKKAEISFDRAKLNERQEKARNEADAKALKTALAMKERLREKMTILSPVDGLISDAVARRGNMVVGESPLLNIISTSRTVEARISEERFAGVAVGKKARVRFLKYGNQEFDAKVSKVLPTADPLTQQKVIFLEVDLVADLLDPGLTGEVLVQVEERENALLVPRIALFGGKLLVVKDGVVELRKVKTGYVGLEKAEILEGVKEGEQVMVDQIDAVRPGDRVRTQFKAQ